MQTARHNVMIPTDEWRQLQTIARQLVHDDEMSRDVSPSGGRVSRMMTLIGDGTLIVIRADEPDPGTK